MPSSQATGTKAADLKPAHFDWAVEDRVATITLNRPERKNPLTFESYAELRDTFQHLAHADDVRAVVHDCLRHRLILTYEANAAGVTADQVIDEIVRNVAVG